MHKIPDTCHFEFVEMKKKGYIRTLKLKLLRKFDEIICDQRITMTYDFDHVNLSLAEAETHLATCIQKQKTGLFGDDEDMKELQNKEIVEARKRVEKCKQTIESLREKHIDYTFIGEVREHKRKDDDTEIVFKVSKTVIDRFEQFYFELEGYRMVVQSQKEWEEQEKSKDTE